MPNFLDLTPPDTGDIQDLLRYLHENFSRLDSQFAKYTQVTSADYTIQQDELVQGRNIYGVFHPDTDVTITLPENPEPEQYIIIKDESRNASTHPITVNTPT